jgi:hypothetical protein
MFHNHATPQHGYITADKLQLNELLSASTHTSGVRLLSPQWGGFHLHMAYAPYGRTLYWQGGTPGGIS